MSAHGAAERLEGWRGTGKQEPMNNKQNNSKLFRLVDAACSVAAFLLAYYSLPSIGTALRRFFPVYLCPMEGACRPRPRMDRFRI